MEDPKSHPSREELAAFSVGKLDAAASSQIEQHLADCKACCELLDSMPVDDTVFGLLRKDKLEKTVTNEHSKDADNEVELAPTIVPEGELETQPPQEGMTPYTKLGEDGLDLPTDLQNHPRYKIVALLGRGGMGDVYRAEHTVMNRAVALKVIKPQLIQNESAVSRFRREVQAAARLTHPNIVTAFDAEQAGDLHYLVMEFVDGTDLDEIVRKHGALSVEKACDYMQQAASGLQHAHELGMVHRDIKPHNLMVEESGSTASGSSEVLKILDFGLANFASEATAEVLEDSNDETPVPSETLHQLTQMGAMMGTPDYIAPEQAQDAHSVDIRADIYSLGCTFYTLLTGKAPFSGGSVTDKIKAHAEDVAKPLAELRSDVPEEVQRIIHKMMAKEANERYQTPAEVAEALAAWKKSLQPRSAHDIKGRVEKNGNPSNNRRAMLWLSIPAAVLVAVCLICIVGVVLNVVVNMATHRGTLVIKNSEFENENVVIQLLQGGKVTNEIQLAAGSTAQRIWAGYYSVQVVEEETEETKVGIRFAMRNNDAQKWPPLENLEEGFTLKRGGGVMLEVYEKLSTELKLVRRFEGHTGPVKKVRFSPDGKLAVSGSGFPDGDRTACIWDVATGERRHRLVGHTHVVMAVDFSPNGETVASGGYDGFVRIWDVKTGEETASMKTKSGIEEIEYHPDGNGILVTHYGGISLLSTKPNDPPFWTISIPERVYSVCIHPDGKRFLAGDKEGGVSVYQLDDGELIETYPLMPRMVQEIHISPDGKTGIATGAGMPPLQFEIETGEVVRQLRNNDQKSVRFSNDGRFAAVSRPLAIIDLATGQTVATIPEEDGYGIWSICFSPNGREFLIGGGSEYDPKIQDFAKQDDYALRLWQLPEHLWSEKTVKPTEE